MITTVTLNAAVDKTYYVKQFGTGEVHRINRQIAEPGGKGNNVAKVIRLLGGEVTATGFIAGSSGTFIVEQLAERGIFTSFVRVPGESRICLNIIDESSGISTELLEHGPTITEEHIATIKQMIHSLAQQSSIVVLSGSLPPGASTNLYAELIGIIQGANARVFLDTSGAALRSGVQACPDFVKPNEQEFEHLVGAEAFAKSNWVEAASRLSGQGITQVCVTLGRRGAIAFIDGKGYRVIPPIIKAVNTVGCGDAFVAGMAFAEERGLSVVEKLRIAAGSAAANAMSDKAGHIDYGLFQSYLKQIQVTAL